jgi:predicted ATPase/class 3 adenylate cyclase
MRHALPNTTNTLSGIRALLLTDVVDSTRLSEQLGDAAMAAVWAAHDRAVRDLLVPWRGREIDKTDGMLLMFDHVADAVHYAHACHQALAALPVPLQARAGLHVGPVLLRENPPQDVARGAKPLEVDGLAKPMAARVMSLARGGQTLITHDALAALHDAQAGVGWHVRSHGHWVMKGVTEPVELFEIGDDPARFEAPRGSDKVCRVVRSGDRWLPVADIPNNLPHHATQFIGRERELKEIEARLAAGTRLITLLGMGGLGKTRLSLQVAAETLHAHPDGAWFIDLTAIRDPDLVVSETARTLDITEEPGRPLRETLCAQLRHRHTILVFDNCEHLVRPVGDLVDALLQAAPKLTVLASSRELLNVPGEHGYPIQPLPLPRRGDGRDALLRSTAARLFVDRVLAHRPDYELLDEDAAEVADLVVRLEGIPLAIELAAARMRTMDVAEINAGLLRRFDMLTGGSRRLQARQQTLRGLVDWSYDMLGTAERAVFDRLAVFVGGFDAESALAVCSSASTPPDDLPAVLQSLVEKSLVNRERAAGGERLRMLETIRDYAAEKLHAGPDADATASRHCEHFFALAKRGRVGMQGPEQRLWLDRLDADLGNLRAALAAALAGTGGTDPFIAVKMAVALQNFWIMRGHVAEGRATVRALLAQPAVADADMARAHALYVGAALACVQSDLAEALPMLQTCLQLRRGLGSEMDIAATLSTLAVTQLGLGDADSAQAGVDEALQRLRACGYRVGEAIALVQRGQVALWREDLGAARGALQQALGLAREIGHPETQGEAELMLGETDLAAGEVDAAHAGFTRALAVCDAAGDLRGSANARWALARVDLVAQRWDSAADGLRAALAAFETFEMREAWLGCLDDHVELAMGHGHAVWALRLAAAAEQLRQRARLPRAPRLQRQHQQRLQRLHAAIDDAHAVEAAWHEGGGWDTAAAQRQATALTTAAVVAAG